MVMRGVEKQSTTITTSYSGQFNIDFQVRNEFLFMITNNNRKNELFCQKSDII
jgi:GTP cyclohydrolase I